MAHSKLHLPDRSPPAPTSPQKTNSILESVKLAKLPNLEKEFIVCREVGAGGLNFRNLELTIIAIQDQVEIYEHRRTNQT